MRTTLNTGAMNARRDVLDNISMDLTHRVVRNKAEKLDSGFNSFKSITIRRPPYHET